MFLPADLFSAFEVCEFSNYVEPPFISPCSIKTGVYPYPGYSFLRNTLETCTCDELPVGFESTAPLCRRSLCINYCSFCSFTNELVIVLFCAEYAVYFSDVRVLFARLLLCFGARHTAIAVDTTSQGPQTPS